MTRVTLVALVLSFALGQVAFAQSPETVLTFDPAAGEIPESVAVDSQGNLFLSMGNGIRKLDGSGQLSTFGSLPIAAFALGVKVGPDACVYTVSTSLNPEVPGAFVWRICAPGEVEQFAELDHSGGPNDLAFDDDGNLFVTDPALGLIWKITPDGAPSIWLSDPALAGNPDAPVLVFRALGVDGIAFDKHKNNLYVSNVDAGAILRIPVQSDGTPGSIATFVQSPQLLGADGIAFDKQGTLFVTVNAQDRLVSIATSGAITILATGGSLDGPSSVAFGTTNTTKRTLYITSSAFSRAFGFQPGTPHPALLKLQVQRKGLPLP